MNTPIALVACSKTKAKVAPGVAIPARDLYRSPLFMGSLAYAQTIADRVWILSTLYGALALDTPVESYDLHLGKLGRAERASWGARVVRALEPQVPPGAAIAVLAGASYIAPLRVASAGRWQLIEPMAGMTIGGRLAFLRQQRGPVSNGR